MEADKRCLARLGLGVALSRQVAELHGGEMMWIESGAQGDNIFAFVLPLDRGVTRPKAVCERLSASESTV